MKTNRLAKVVGAGICLNTGARINREGLAKVGDGIIELGFGLTCSDEQQRKKGEHLSCHIYELTLLI